MTDLKKFLIIFLMIITVYRNKLKQLIDTTAKKIFSYIFVLSMIGISTFLANVLTKDVIVLFLNGDSKILYSAVLTYLISLSVITFFLFVILKFIDPNNSKILKVLDSLDLKPHIKYIGYYSFQLIIEIVIPFLMFSIIIVPHLIQHDVSIHIPIIISALFFSQSLFITTISHISYNCLYFMGSRIKIPYIKSFILLIQTVIMARVGFNTITNMHMFLVNYDLFPNHLLIWNGGLVGKLFIGDSFIVNNILIISSQIISIIICIFSFTLLSGVERNDEYHSKILWSLQSPMNRYLSLFFKDVKLLLRSENTSLLLFILYGLNIFIFISETSIPPFLLLKFNALLIATLPFPCYGIDNKMLTFYKFLGIGKYTYILSKLLSAYFIGVILFLTTCVVASLDSWKELFISLSIFTVSTICCFILGIAFPYNKNNPSSQISLIFLGTVGLFPISYLINKFSVFSFSMQLFLIVLLLLIGILVTISIINFRWEKESL
ncbi:hypothetical protein [Enterococcus hirae]|uniref:hypothetical protein n=1 Tax=Enterococcus hirae TaxID=1354 RepID=UPI00313BBF6B